ncbi:MaoC family dehydratase [Aureimonas mangrovi]|uniref:MaoC family dehydratase n=1 Tax=Aureimonas mangrovi TaxID=2758041 RepID=UPI00163DE09B|nr:MaoC family dehydratase [Aureimonas mangrovi]
MSYWDTLEIGRVQELGSHTFEKDEIVRFARKYDPQPFHLDEEAAHASTLGGLCASGWHITAAMMRLLVDFRRAEVAAHIAAGNPAPLLGPSPGVTNIRWLKPVFAGDTLTYRATVTGKRASKSKVGWGVVESHTTATNGAGTEVFSLDAAAFVGTD